MSRVDVIVRKLADTMDPDNARALVDEVVRETFIAGFDAGVNAIDANSEQFITVEQAFEAWSATR